MDREDNDQLAMLDTPIHRKTDGSTKITIYRKPTHADQYLLMESHLPSTYTVSPLCNLGGLILVV